MQDFSHQQFVPSFFFLFVLYGHMKFLLLRYPCKAYASLTAAASEISNIMESTGRKRLAFKRGLGPNKYVRIRIHKAYKGLISRGIYHSTGFYLAIFPMTLMLYLNDMGGTFRRGGDTVMEEKFGLSTSRSVGKQIDVGNIPVTLQSLHRNTYSIFSRSF